MFNKEDSRKLREEFWIAFGKSFPIKWILYKTKIKGLSFNNKEISRIYVELKNVSIHNKNTWRETMEFLNQSMHQIEVFFEEYKDIIDY